MDFDLQRFGDGDAVAPAQDAGAVDASAQVEPQPAGPDATGSGQAGEGQQAAPQGLFTQEQVNAIVERRLERERRRWEREIAELKRQMQQPPAAQQPVADRQEQARQFLVEFSRDPLGTLEKFAQTYMARQTQQAQSLQERVQSVVQEAIGAVSDVYPDFAQHAPAVMSQIQSDPAMMAALRRINADPDPMAYRALLESAYLRVKMGQLRNAQVVAGAQVAQEQQAASLAKRAGAAPVQKAAASKQPVEEDPADVLFKAMKSVR